MPTALERVIERMNRIENNFDKIYVRVGDQSIPLSELPSEVAAQWIFKWLREVINETT